MTFRECCELESDSDCLNCQVRLIVLFGTILRAPLPQTSATGVP